ncbi:MAG: GspH/FimT family pseudopilin [Thiomonas sp.]
MSRLDVGGKLSIHIFALETPVRLRTTGFTLIELLVTLTVAAVLLAVAIPSFQNLALSNRLTTTANAMVHALNLARSEAVKRNQDISFDNTAAIVTTASNTTIAAAPTLPTGIQKVSGKALIASPAGYLRQSSGTGGFSGLVMDLYAANLPSGQHRCIYLITGITPVACTADETGTGKCPNAQPNPCLQ